MNKYDGLARIILQNVGGKSNIETVTHCITRLRFKLKDESKAQTDILKRTDGVVNVIKSGGLYQVVIGTSVGDVYDALLEVGHLENLAEVEASNAGEKKGALATFISTVTGVFVPILGMLCATGVIKGVLTLLTFFHWMDPNGGTYRILYNGADALFYFLPVLIGYTSAKKFGMNEITGLMLGLILCAPAIVGIAPNRIAILNGKAPEALGTFLGMKYWTTLFGIPVIMPGSGNYTSSVIPIILIVWFGSIIEKKVKKIMPSELKSFGVPFVVLIVATAVGLIVIGPIAGIITDLIAAGAKFIFDVAPIVAGALIGGFWQILVVFGLHWALVPFKVINIASQGFDQMVTPYFAVSFAQLAALIAVVIKTKDKQTKSLGIPAIISAVAGVTEPAIYGITLPRKKPFIYSCIGGAIGGAIISAAKAYSYISGGLGVFGIPGFIMTPEYAERYGVQQNMNGVVWALVAVAISMVFTFVITMLFYTESETGSFTGKVKTNENTSDVACQSDVFVASPMEGTVMELSEVPDEAFSSGSLGKGCAILPKLGEVKAPCDGVISVLPDTYHAVAVTTASGADVLIHIGMNTVELKGKYFTPMVKEGQSVKKGDLLIKFDIDNITKAGYKITTPVIVSNSDDFVSVVAEKKSKSEITFGEHLLTASK